MPYITVQLIPDTSPLTEQDFRRRILSLEYDDDYTFWILEGTQRGDSKVKELCSSIQHMNLEDAQNFLNNCQ